MPQAAPPATPAGTDALKFRLRRIVVTGAFAELAVAGAAIAAPLQDRQVSVAQLYAFAGALEKLYAENGYPLARVAVPPQRLADGGDARVEVIDGFIERLALAAVPERARRVVAARLEALIDKRHLRYSELERAVLLAGDAPGLRLRSALARGQRPGGVVLTLEAEERLVSASLGSDNNLPASLGGVEWNGRLALNNPLGLGEQAYLSLASGYAMGLNGFPMSPLRTLGAGFIAPIGTQGLTLNPEITQSRTRPAPTLGAVPSQGEFKRFALRGAYPLVRAREHNLTLNGSLEAVDQKLYGVLDGEALSHDCYLAARAGASWQGAAFWGAALQADAQISQGLGGQEPDDGRRLSRQGARPVFTRLTGGLRLTQPVGDTRLDLSARGQWAFGKPKLASEQFSLDAVDGLSAFTQGALSVDAGEVVRLEASRAFAPPFAPGALTMAPYLFAAAGAGVIHQPTLVEAPQVSTLAFGIGARVAFDAPDGSAGASLGLELSRGRASLPNLRSADRVAASFNLHY